MAAIDFSKVVRTRDMKGADSQEDLLLAALLDEAKRYVSAFEWCQGITDSYLGIGIGGVIGVFLMNIETKSHDVDDWLWIVVGDVPPAYITTDDAPNPACALDAYIGAMSEWVEAAKSGRPVNDLIPVNVPATPANARQLESRLKFLDKRVLSRYREDLV